MKRCTEEIKLIYLSASHQQRNRLVLQPCIEIKRGIKLEIKQQITAMTSSNISTELDVKPKALTAFELIYWILQE
jgi:hypothetical protein